MSSPNLPTTGDVVANRYRLGREIGSGGFGVIYEAHQNRKPRRVALKLMSYTGAQVGPREMKRRFRREAVMASNLIHPHSVRQFDFGDQGDYFYLVMEFLDGETLGERVERSGPISTDLAIRVARATLEVLHLAHQKDIVHRDLKPDNIMLCRVDGDPDFPKVLDFGAAKTTHGQHDLTSAGVALGSPDYMAPEILLDHDPLAASDIYSLGITLGEALVGDKIVPGDTPIDRARNQISPDPLEFPGRLVNHPLYPWLSGALRKDPNKRYASAQVMLRKIDALKDAPPFSSRPSPASTMDDDFSAESTVLISADDNPIHELTDANDDFEVEPTVVGSPDEDTSPLVPALDESSQTSSNPPPPRHADAPTAQLSNPLHEALSNAPTSSPPASPAPDERRSPPPSPPADSSDDSPDEHSPSVDESDYYGAFQREHEPLGDDFDEPAANEIEPTADKDYMLVNTSEGRDKNSLIPVLIFGTILLIFLILVLSVFTGS